MSLALLRFTAYGILGWGVEVLWTAIYDAVSRPVDWRLRGYSSLWMFPIYGATLFLFEPLHDFLRVNHVVLRLAAYILGIWVVEYAAAWILEKACGRAPWDYSAARWNLHGRIRWDYAPLWAIFGWVLERTHDALMAGGPALLGVKY